MKKKSIIAGAALAASFAALILCAPSLSAQTTETRPLIFPAESVASTDYNTGKVYFSLLKSTGNTMITHFRFTAGSRNFWHYHPADQTLLVLDGEGFYQEEGGPKRTIRKGDVIVSPQALERRHSRTGLDLHHGNRIRLGGTCRPTQGRHGRGIRPITEKKRRPIPAAWP